MGHADIRTVYKIGVGLPRLAPQVHEPPELVKVEGQSVSELTVIAYGTASFFLVRFDLTV